MVCRHGGRQLRMVLRQSDIIFDNLLYKGLFAALLPHSRVLPGIVPSFDFPRPRSKKTGFLKKM
jgi:hypothetical protein